MIKVWHYLKSSLFLLSLGIFAIGYVVGRFNVLLVGVLLLFLSNVITGFLNRKTHIIFLFFHFVLFTFLISRPFISFLKGGEWWYLGREGTLFALNALFITMIALRIGANAADKLLQSKGYRLDNPPQRTENTDFIRALQAVSLAMFFITMVFFLISETEKLIYMQGRSYGDYYLTFESSLPYYISVLASMMKYFLCIFLATMPSKKAAVLPLVLYVLSAIPSLIIGIRNPIVLNCLFAFIYFLLRDIVGNCRKWFGKFERCAVIIALPIAIMFLSAYNYLRDGVSVDMSITESVTDFFYKQGVSFDVLCRGYNAIPDLPDVIPKNYTFGGFIDYFTHGSFAQAFFGAANLGSQNSVFRAVYGHSFAHSMSYVAHPQYLEGHGWGSSYLLETFADWGYCGIIIFSLVLGGLTVAAIYVFSRRGPLVRTIILMGLTSFFFMPRAEATGWIEFIATAQFWLAVGFSWFCALVLYDRNTVDHKLILYSEKER